MRDYKLVQLSVYCLVAAVLLLGPAVVAQEPVAPDPAELKSLGPGPAPSPRAPTGTTSGPSIQAPDIASRTEDQVKEMLALAPPGNEPGAVPGLRTVTSSRFLIGDSLAVLLASCACLCLLAPGSYLFYTSLQGEAVNLEVLGKALSLLCILSLAWVLFIYSLAFSRNAHSYDAAQAEIQVENLDIAPGNKFIGDLTHAGFSGLGSNWEGDRLRFPLRRTVDRIPHIYFMTLQMTIFLQAIVPLLVVTSVRVIDRWSVLPFWLMWSTLIYAPLCYWIQGGGWLADCLDSGAAVPVHLSTGFTALGLYLFKKPKSSIPGGSSSLPNDLGLVIGVMLFTLGSLILAAGRTMILHPWPTPCFLNMFLSGAAGLLLWVGLRKRNARAGNWNDWPFGVISGLVAIASGCSLVEPGCALAIGAAGSLASYLCIYGRPASAQNLLWLLFSVHGVSGLVGLILVGVFASADVAGSDVTGKAIMGLTSGNTDQIRTQVLAGCISALTAIVGGAVLPALAAPFGAGFKKFFSPHVHA